MRFLVKIPVPTAAENPVVRNPGFDDMLRALYLELRAQATYSTPRNGSRVDYILIDVEPADMAAIARPIFELLQVKVEFLPEVTPQKSFGHVNT